MGRGVYEVRLMHLSEEGEAPVVRGGIALLSGVMSGVEPAALGFVVA